MNTLRTLLDAGEQFDPLYVPSLNTDHLPMTLVAMSELGASDAALNDFQARYRERLRPVVEGIEVASVEEGRGRYDAFESMRELLKHEVAEQGVETVIRKYLPSLLPTVAAGAFHPIIRLGFAVKANHDVEVATSLAYWLTTSLKPELVAAEPGLNLAQTLRSLEPVDLATGRFSEGLYKLVDMNQYPAPIDTTLEECAQASLAAYLGTRNFFALHFVTATQAARVCAKYVNEGELVAALTAAIQAGYLIVGAPDFGEVLPPPKQLDEEHNIKYVYACSEEYKAYGDPRYRQEMCDFVAAGLVPDWILIPD